MILVGRVTYDASIQVPDFRGRQALDAWLSGYDAGLLLQGPDPDSPEPLLNGVVVDQIPFPGTRVGRWDAVTVWLRHGPDQSGVREPRRPRPPAREAAAELPIGPQGDHGPWKLGATHSAGGPRSSDMVDTVLIGIHAPPEQADPEE